MNKLERCPFCGGQVLMNVNTGNQKAPHGFITCNKCNICFTLHHTHNPELVSNVWNKRFEKFNTGDRIFDRNTEEWGYVVSYSTQSTLFVKYDNDANEAYVCEASEEDLFCI